MLLRCLVPSSDGLERTAGHLAMPNQTIIYVMALPNDDRHAYWAGHDTIQSRYQPCSVSGFQMGTLAGVSLPQPSEVVTQHTAASPIEQPPYPIDFAWQNRV